MENFNLKKMAKEAKEASTILAVASTEQKNRVLEEICKRLEFNKETILNANREDLEQAKAKGLSESMIDRMSLHGRLEGIVADVRTVIHLPDPVGEIFEQKTLPNGLELAKCRTAIGVLGVVYESRPNVTIDISALSIKSGNCALLRGGSETLKTNLLLVKAIREALTHCGMPEAAIQLIPSVDREQVKKMLKLYQQIDLVIPRGGAGLHKFCRENSKIPVITGGVGVCHLFADQSADLHRSLPLIINAKTQRPTVCNALDTLLVHRQIAKEWVPAVVQALHAKGCQFSLDAKALKLVANPGVHGCRLAAKGDWDTEWLSLTLGIKIVDGLEGAIAHIAKHSTRHSDGILTQNRENGELFLKQVDSAAVYLNASTRFTDGGQLGLGAEVAISTQKIHARGPMGLEELTSYKRIIRGDYSIRQ